VGDGDHSPLAGQFAWFDGIGEGILKLHENYRYFIVLPDSVSFTAVAGACGEEISRPRLREPPTVPAGLPLIDTPNRRRNGG